MTDSRRPVSAEHARSRSHGRAGEYLEGLLDDDQAAAFEAHVVDCEACQAELHGEVQLRDREDSLRARAGAGDVATPVAEPAARPERPTRVDAPISSLADARARRRRTLIVGGLVLAAAAVIALLVWPRGGGGRGKASPTLALAPTRALEPRLVWPGAAAYRPYDTQRGSAAGETIDPRVIAQLAERDDCAGVAAAYVLSGELARARQQYDRCGDGAGLDADRAGLAVLEGDPERALELADRALAAAPDHPVALWNRALALRDLGLGMAAAAAFDRVAERDPAWADEARRRAAAARDPLQEIRRAYDEVERIGRAMATGGPLIPAELARQVPARTRIFWHDALRLADSPARVDELRPLAATLDGLAGTDLARYADAAAKRPSAETLAGYRAMFDGATRMPDADWQRWLAAARRDGAADHILAARILTGRYDDGEPDGATVLAERTEDAWFRMPIAIGTARKARSAGDLARADELITAAGASCPGAAPAYRCVQLAVEAALVAIARFQLPRARDVTRGSLALATSIGEWPQRRQSLHLGGDAALLRGKLSLARAQYEDAARSTEGCAARDSFFAMADVDYLAHRFADAAAAIAAAPPCTDPPTQNHVNLLAKLLRTGHGPLARDALHQAIAHARTATTVRADHRLFDFVDAWIDLPAPEARTRLRAMRDAAAGATEAPEREMIASADGALVVEAAERDAWDEAVAAAATALGVTPPRACAMVVAIDEYRLAAIALDPSGRPVGHRETDRAAYRPGTWRAPPALEAAVAGCAHVAVLALPPWIGVGPVFAPAVPWSYTMGPPPPPSDAPAHRLIVSATEPPRELGLPPLLPASATAGARVVSGAAATPERVLAEARTATSIELHTHALWTDAADTPVIALSPGSSGWSLGPDNLVAGALPAAPVVVLANCASGATAPYLYEPSGLPMAFRRAGARAVIAPLVPIPDREAGAFFQELGQALDQGATPAAAVARLRAAKISRDPASWVSTVTVFE